MHVWSIVFINKIAESEFEALPMDMAAKFLRAFDLLQAKGLAALSMPMARPVEGKIWELRATGRDGIARSLYVTATGQRLVILRTFTKKTQKTPRQEIQIALRRLEEID